MADAAATHTVGAFAVIFDSDARVLLCLRADKDMWNLPGGRLERDESPWQAVVREVAEECGLQVSVERLVGVYAVPARHDLVFVFVCVRTGGELRTSDEAKELGWFDPRQLPPNTLERHRARIADACANLPTPCLNVQY